jgi:hypothetical protein
MIRMKNKTKFNHDITFIKALLRSIRPFPSKDFQRRMDLAPWKLYKDHNLARLQVRRLVKLASIAVGAIMLISLAFSPIGRVLAEEIIHFFNEITGNTLPLDPDQIQEPIPTPQPTYYSALLPADQAALPEEDTPAEPEAAPQIDPAYLQDMDIMSARAMMDFPLFEPAYLPQGYRLQNIHSDDTCQVLSMTYSPDASTEGITVELSESRSPFDVQITEDTNQETISVAGKAIELFSRGGQPLPDGADEILLWRQDDVSLKLSVYSKQDGNEIAYQRDDWLAVIEGLTTCQVNGSTNDYACEINRAAVAAGFIPWQFPEAPEGYSFNKVIYSPGMTAIWYASPVGELGLLQSEEDFKTQETSDWFSVPADAIENITVAGQPAEYVDGDFVAEPGQDHAVWNPGTDHIRLRWKQDNWWFQFVKWGSPRMQPQELADLASDLVSDPAQINAEQQLNSSSGPEIVVDAYLTLAEAEEAYGKKFLQPGFLPEYLPFSHARLGDNDMLMLFYGDFAEDKVQMNGDGLVFIQGNVDTSFMALNEDFPPEAITETQVNDSPAKLISGTMQVEFDAEGQSLGDPQWVQEPFMLTLYWELGDRFYLLRFYAAGGSGTRIEAADLIKIAESLQK